MYSTVFDLSTRSNHEYISSPFPCSSQVGSTAFYVTAVHFFVGRNADMPTCSPLPCNDFGLTIDAVLHLSDI